MVKTSATRGSALLISLVIVLITAGLGGAFLFQAVYHSNEAKWSIEADEAMTMCDAGMELARQAMGAYRSGNAPATQKWKWQDMITYCNSRDTVTVPWDSRMMKQDALAYFKTPNYGYYQAWINQNGQGSSLAYNNYVTGSSPVATLPNPASPTAWSQSDTYPALPSWDGITQPPPKLPYSVPIGNTIPFQRGAIFIRVSYPDASTSGDPSNAKVTVTATLATGLQRSVEGVVTKPFGGGPPIKARASGVAAVVSNDVVNLNGSITIDGRDHQYTPNSTTAITSPPPLTNPVGNVLGIASNSNTSIPTNGSVGGNGGAPPQPKGAAPGSVVPNYNFSSLGGYPTTPDSALSQDGTTALAEGTIKQTAINNGTYFNSQAAFTTWLGTQPSPLPGGNVLYLDFTPGNGTFNLGPGNINSSIMIIHTSTDSGIVQEVHGAFTGLIIADGFVRNNGVGQITGQVQLLSPTSSTAGNVFGNGNAEIDYSSAALANLPGLGGSTSSLSPAPATLSSYRRINY